MPHTLTIQGGHKGSTKVSRDHAFSTLTEMKDAVAKGQVPTGFDNMEHFYRCAVAHRVVEIQNEIRAEIDGPKTKTSKNPLFS
jgi:hypothetical protein